MTQDTIIQLNSRDFYLKTLDNGVEVINLRGGTAFDENFIQECKSKGVKEEIKKDDDKTDNNKKDDDIDLNE